ncbi:MAG TPA: DUF1569 domain-containing protein [Holophagaceae bacterium]|jgi:hypothetical protein|nr:DUF1569 domain-containing protein [Holophagaceae bacterium]
MKNLFESGRAEELKARAALLMPDSPRLWGRMSVAQAMAHCAAGMEMATGDLLVPRVLIGRLIGGFVKPKVLGDDEPFRRGSPTAKKLVIADERELDKERVRLCALIDRFATAGPAGCTQHPHSFFGPLTPEEWAILTYKHLDHHLRQFGG